MSSASHNQKKRGKQKQYQQYNEVTAKSTSTTNSIMQELQGGNNKQFEPNSENVPFEKNSNSTSSKSQMDEYYNLINKFSSASGASELRINPKDEKMHLKTMRTFFFLQAIGFTCRLRKLPSEDEFDQPLREHESSGGAGASQLVIEGILYSCDANSSHIILEQATILKVYGDDPYSSTARTELIRRAERASVNLSEVKEIRFDGLDITKNGIVPLITSAPRKVEEVPPSREENQTDAKQVQRPLSLKSQELKEAPVEEAQAQILEKAVSPAKASSTISDSYNTATNFKEKDSPFKKIPPESSPGKKKVTPSPKLSESSPMHKQPQTPNKSGGKKVPKSPNVSTFTIQPEIDEAIVVEKFSTEKDNKGDGKEGKNHHQPKSSKSSRVNTPRAPKTPKKQKQNKQQQQEAAASSQRELVRFKSDKKIDSAQQEVLKVSLEDDSKNADEAVSQPFDQFKDKKTTYDFRMYTSTFDESKVTTEQRQMAEKIEQEILKDPASKKMNSLEEGSDLTDEMKFSSVRRTDAAEDVEQSLQVQNDEANPGTMKQNQESMEMFKRGLMSKVQSKKSKDDLAQNATALQSFKEQVLNKLSPPSKSKKAEAIPQNIKMRSYDPDGAEQQRGKKDEAHSIQQSNENIVVVNAAEETAVENLGSKLMMATSSFEQNERSGGGSGDIRKEVEAESQRLKDCQETTEITSSINETESSTLVAETPQPIKRFKNKQFSCINKVKGISGNFQENYSLFQHQKEMNQRQEQAKLQAARHNEQQKHVQELGKVLVPGMASRVQTMTPSIHFSQYLAKELVSDTWRASNQKR